MLRNGKEVDGQPYEDAIQSIIDAEGNLSELRWHETWSSAAHFLWHAQVLDIYIYISLSPHEVHVDLLPVSSGDLWKKH